MNLKLSSFLRFDHMSCMPAAYNTRLKEITTKKKFSSTVMWGIYLDAAGFQLNYVTKVYFMPTLTSQITAHIILQDDLKSMLLRFEGCVKMVVPEGALSTHRSQQSKNNFLKVISAAYGFLATTMQTAIKKLEKEQCCRL